MIRQAVLQLTIQPPRYNLDSWDQMMVERDRRLTGSWRGQSVRCASLLSDWDVLVRGGSVVSGNRSGTADMVEDRRRRGGTTNPAAPKDFATNSIWETERIR